MAAERLGIGPIARLRISWVAVMRADSDRPFMQTFIRVVKAAAAAASKRERVSPAMALLIRRAESRLGYIPSLSLIIGVAGLQSRFSAMLRAARATIAETKAISCGWVRLAMVVDFSWILPCF